MQYELGMPHFKWYWRLQQSCSNQSSCLFWKLRDASPLHFKWTQSDERCTFEKYLFCILGGGGESIFLCLSLIKKAKTRICLYTENRLKKHLVCSMNRRNDYIKSTLKWVDFASLKGFVSDRVGKKDDLAGFKLSTVSAHTVWSIRLCYDPWAAFEATTWITYADEVARYRESSSSRSFAAAKATSQKCLSPPIWCSLYFPSPYLSVTLDWFVIHTYCTNKSRQSWLCANMIAEPVELTAAPWLCWTPSQFANCQVSIFIASYGIHWIPTWACFICAHCVSRVRFCLFIYCTYASDIPV